MIAGFFLKGVGIGFSIAAPVGAIGILCIRRTLRDGLWTGFFSGLGAATADAAYACIAALGLGAVSGFLAGHQAPIRIVGGAFIAYLGVRAYRSQPDAPAQAVPAMRMLAAYGSTFVLTLTNPSTIVSFTLVFAALGLGTRGGPGPASAMVLGVFLGSAIWWLLLSSGVSLLRSRVDFRWMKAVNRITGVLLFALGIGLMCR
jgi:threonine/homoserine/homoserine lactone efflux protein